MRTHFFAASVLALAAATPASAAVVIFTDQAAFDDATSSTTTEDFSDSVTPGLTIVSTAGSIGNGRFNDRLRADQSVFTDFVFQSPVSAFGGLFDLRAGGQGLGIRVSTTPGGDIGTEINNALAGGFFGFTSDTPFTRVRLTGGTQASSNFAETYNVDNVQFGALAGGGVPEPSVWAFLILGFGAVGAGMRRKSSTRLTVRYS